MQARLEALGYKVIDQGDIPIEVNRQQRAANPQPDHQRIEQNAECSQTILLEPGDKVPADMRILRDHPANLMNVCEGCHDALHAEGGQHRRVKTSAGYQLQRI